MPWARLTDTAATHPIVLAVAEHPDADDRSVNEVFGFMLRLAAMSAQYLTDYVFWYSSAVQMAGSKSQADQLLELAAFAGYGVQDVEPGSGRRFFRLVADSDFVHIKTAEEVAWERDRKANNGDLSIIVPVRWRDGDACRYCGKVVNWADRKGGKGGTYDHRLPGQSGTWRSEVVACRSCNSIRGNASKGLPPSEGMAAADRVRPLLTPPDRPYYSPRTREWLNSHADVLALHDMRPPELAAGEEAGVLDLLLVDPDVLLPARRPRLVGEHEGAGERPRLRSHVADLLDADACLQYVAGGALTCACQLQRRVFGGGEERAVELADAGGGDVVERQAALGALGDGELLAAAGPEAEQHKGAEEYTVG